MSTTTQTWHPTKVAGDAYCLQELKDGLANATAGTCPPQLHERMEDSDLRYDEICNRAIARILPGVVTLLDDAIAAEWARAPIYIERRAPDGAMERGLEVGR